MPSDVDKVKSGLVSFIRRTLGASIINRIDYLAFYPCKVVAQNADGTLELVADDSRVGSPSGVPIRYGVPGVKATVPSGSRCYLGFGGGDPRKPIVVDWESGAVLTIIVAGGTQGAARIGDSTTGHNHTATFSLVAGATPVTGTITISTNTDTIAQGSAKVKIG